MNRQYTKILKLAISYNLFQKLLLPFREIRNRFHEIIVRLFHLVFYYKIV